MMAPADNRSTAPIPDIITVQNFSGQLGIQIGDELLVQGDERIVIAGLHALDHQWEMSPLMREILRRLFDREDVGVRKIIVTHGLLTIFYTPRDELNQEFYESLIRDAAFAVGAMEHLKVTEDE
jgi:hypothetical protein